MDDADFNAEHIRHGNYSQNNPFIWEDESGTLWDETTGLPIVSNRDRYNTPGSGI